MIANYQINDLLEMLEMDKIKKKIRSIVNDNENSITEIKSQLSNDNSIDIKSESFQNTYALAQNEKNVLQKEIETQKNIISSMQKEKEVLQNKLKESLQKIVDIQHEKDNEIAVQKTKNSNLEYDRNLLKRQVDDIKPTIANLNDKVDKLKIQLDKKERELIEHIEFFKDAKKYFEKYACLDDSIKTPLKGIFKDNSAELFICAGVQWENIEAIWEFLQTQLGKQITPDSTPMLVEMFKYFFELYRSMQDRPIYQMQSVSVGDIFDEDKHSRSVHSSVRGKISEILLPGYVNVRTGKTIKKTIVRVR